MSPRAFELLPDAVLTSTSATAVPHQIESLKQADIFIGQVVVQRTWQPDRDTDVWLPTRMRPLTVEAQISMTGLGEAATLISSDRGYRYVFHRLTSGDVVFNELRIADLVARGPSRDSWTPSTVAVGLLEPSGIGQALGDLSQLIQAIRRFEVPMRSPETLALARRVGDSRGIAERVDEWARRLAEKIADFDD